MSHSKIIIKGKPIDENTRCVHYHSPLDVIAIKLKCCNFYYPCIKCHTEEANHPVEVWSRDELDSKAVLCGICNNELTIKQYLTCKNICPFCAGKFNPNCSAHYHFYFEI